MTKRNTLPGKPEALSVKRNALWNTVGSFIYLAANWLITVLVVVLGSGYSDSGTLAVAMAVGNIYATIILFRVRPIQVSDVNEQFAAGEYVSLRIICSLIGAGFCLVYSLFTVASADMPVVLLYMAFKCTDSFVDVYEGVVQQHGRLDYPAVSQILRGVLVLVLFSVGMVVFRNLAVAVLLMTVGSLVVVVCYDVPKASMFANVKPKFSRKHVALLFGMCMPGFLASIACTFVVSISRQIFGLNFGSEALGIYAAVATPTAVVQALVGYLYAPLLGPMAKNWAQDNTKYLSKTIGRVAVLVTLATAACIVLGKCFGEWALTLVYGQTIAGYSNLLTLMLVCTAVTGMMYFLVDMLVIFRDFRGSIIASLVALLATPVFITVFYQSFDYNNISIVITFAYSCGAIVALWFISKDITRKSQMHVDTGSKQVGNE